MDAWFAPTGLLPVAPRFFPPREGSRPPALPTCQSRPGRRNKCRRVSAKMTRRSSISAARRVEGSRREPDGLVVWYVVGSDG
eukprot:1028460-Amorphochlora_amoeboformis.AAC.1